MSDDKDNPFGSTPPDNPFGSTPSDNPFGSTPSDNPFGASSADFGRPPPSSPPPPPNEAWRESGPPRDPLDAPPPSPPPERASGAIASLVLGILGLVLCPLFAPFAWALGKKAEGLVDASGGRLIGRGEATAGKILGIVSCVLTILLIVLFIALIAVGSSVSTSS